MQHPGTFHTIDISSFFFVFSFFFFLVSQSFMNNLIDWVLFLIHVCAYSLNWQHQLCKNPRPNPDIKTLFTDHSCAPTNGARTPPSANSPLVGPIPKAGGFPPVGAHSVSVLLNY